MRNIFRLLLLLLPSTALSQSVPGSVADTLNALRVKKNIYRDAPRLTLRKAPARISGTGYKIFTDTLMLFSFSPAGAQRITHGLDSSLWKRNKTYQYYVAGTHGYSRGFYYRGKFTVTEPHAESAQLDTSVSGAGLVYLDTAVMIVTRLHRYLVTEWKPYKAEDSAAMHGLHLIFVFNKSGKLLNRFAYDNHGLTLANSVGFFNRDDLLDVVYLENTRQVDGKTEWHFKLYSLDKKGRTKEAKFHKGRHERVITVH